LRVVGNVIDAPAAAVTIGTRVRCTWTAPLPAADGAHAIRLPQWTIEENAP
jgi:hypothetical protein